MGKKEHERRGGKIQSTDDPGGSCRWVPLDGPQLPPMDPPPKGPQQPSIDLIGRASYGKLRGGEHCKPSAHQRCNWGSRDVHAAQENAPRGPHPRRGLERHFFAFLCLFLRLFFGTLGGHLLEGPFLPPPSRSMARVRRWPAETHHVRYRAKQSERDCGDRCRRGGGVGVRVRTIRVGQRSHARLLLLLSVANRSGAQRERANATRSNMLNVQRLKRESEVHRSVETIEQCGSADNRNSTSCYEKTRQKGSIVKHRPGAATGAFTRAFLSETLRHDSYSVAFSELCPRHPREISPFPERPYPRHPLPSALPALIRPRLPLSPSPRLPSSPRSVSAARGKGPPAWRETVRRPPAPSRAAGRRARRYGRPRAWTGPLSESGEQTLARWRRVRPRVGDQRGCCRRGRPTAMAPAAEAGGAGRRDDDGARSLRTGLWSSRRILETHDAIQ